MENKRINVAALNSDNTKLLNQFTFNRSDLLYKNNNFLLTFNDNINYYLGFHLEEKTIFIQSCLLEFGSQENFEAIIRYLFKHYHPEKIFCHYCLYNFHNNLLPDHNFSVVLPDTFDELLSREKRKKRYNLKRERKILNQQGFYFKELSRKSFHDALVRFFGMKMVTHNRDWHLTPEEFIDKYNITNVYVLINSETDIIAVVLSNEMFNNVVYQQTAYDKQWERFSPGSVIYLYFLEEMIKKGKEQVFLGGESCLQKNVWLQRRLYV